MLILNVGIVIICGMVIIFVIFFFWFRVLSGCCLVVMHLGCGMSFEVMYLYVNSACSDRDYFCNYMYMYAVLRLS